MLDPLFVSSDQIRLCKVSVFVSLNLPSDLPHANIAGLSEGFSSYICL